MNRPLLFWTTLTITSFLFLTTALPAQSSDKQDARPPRTEARAEEPSRSPRQMDEDALHHLLDGLGLTDEQQARIRDTLNDARQRRQTWWHEHGQTVHQLRQAINDARQARDRDTFRERWAQLGELMFDAPQPSTVEDIRDILTDEQRQKLQVNWEQARERMEQRRRHRRDRDDNNTDTDSNTQKSE